MPTILTGLIVGCLLLLPLLSYAQASNSAELNATIKAAILKDPRTAGLSAAQIQSMIQALSAKAQSQGVTAQDIAYRPGTPGIVVPAVGQPASSDPCVASAWCAAGEYVGGGVARNIIYVAFWILAIILILVIWRMRKNPHLTSVASRPETPAIGGGV